MAGVKGHDSSQGLHLTVAVEGRQDSQERIERESRERPSSSRQLPSLTLLLPMPVKEGLVKQKDQRQNKKLPFLQNRRTLLSLKKHMKLSSLAKSRKLWSLHSRRKLSSVAMSRKLSPQQNHKKLSSLTKGRKLSSPQSRRREVIKEPSLQLVVLLQYTIL